MLDNLGISIHEAAKASTMNLFSTSIKREISIHEAAKASTSVCRINMTDSRFQSTKPQRLRQVDSISGLADTIISIHEAAKASTARHLF